MRRLSPFLLLVACRGAPEVAAPVDTGVEDEDAAIVVPPLDPVKCGTVSGDEAPMALAGVRTDATELDKAFPFFAALERRSDLLDRLKADATLAAIGDARAKKLADAKACADAPCVEALLSWTDDERAAAGEATAKALGDAAFVAAFRASGRKNVDAALADDVLVKKAVVDELRWAESALGNGREIDKAKRDAALDAAKKAVFYQPTLFVSLAYLAANARDEATRYEPLSTGENAAALATFSGIDWKAYPFSAIVVPGLGPSDATTALTEGGKQRCDLAAARWRAKIAPVILTSGGHVHPDRTKFAEAIEMKKYLVSLGVPASAILVDPHARHTTTNLRNAARILLRYGAPPNAPVLVTSDPFQSLYMQGAPFAQRCRDEMGLVPFRSFVSLSLNDSCVFSSRVALSVDARDPLDP